MKKQNKEKAIGGLKEKIIVTKEKIVGLQEKIKMMESAIEKHQLEMFKEDFSKYEKLMEAAENAGLDYDGTLKMISNSANFTEHSVSGNGVG